MLRIDPRVLQNAQTAVDRGNCNPGLQPPERLSRSEGDGNEHDKRPEQ